MEVLMCVLGGLLIGSFFLLLGASEPTAPARSVLAWNSEESEAVVISPKQPNMHVWVQDGHLCFRMASLPRGISQPITADLHVEVGQAVFFCKVGDSGLATAKIDLTHHSAKILAVALAETSAKMSLTMYAHDHNQSTRSIYRATFALGWPMSGEIEAVIRASRIVKTQPNQTVATPAPTAANPQRAKNVRHEAESAVGALRGAIAPYREDRR